SRYMLDFAPAFVAAMVGLWNWVNELWNWKNKQLLQWKQYSKPMALSLFAVLIVWQGMEIGSAQSIDSPPGSLTRENVKDQKGISGQSSAEFLSQNPLPNE